jgi:hypothetical protein
MERVVRFVTNDGVLHPHFLAAERHAEERYGKAVTALAHSIVRVEKYKDATDWVEKHIAEFVALKVLADDRILPPANEDDE